MKKFLSVLLALAVAFTFTFGSCMTAFATAADDAATAALSLVNASQTAGSEAVTENGDVAVTYTGSTTWAVPAANWQTAYADAFTKLQSAVGANTAAAETDWEVLNAVMGSSLASTSTTADKKAAIVNYLTNTTTGTTYATASAVKAIVPELTVVLANAKVVANGVDLKAYSTSTITKEAIAADGAYYLGTYLWATYSYANGAVTANTTADTYVAKEVAQSMVNVVVAKLDAISTAEIKTLDEAKDARKAIDDAFAGYVSVTGDTNHDYVEAPAETIATALVAQSSKLPMTSAQETADNYAKENAVSTELAKITSNINAVKASTTYTALEGNDKADYDAELEAYKTAMTYLANNGGSVTAAPVVGSTVNGANVAIANTVNTLAANAKAEKNEDGKVKYDAETIDKNVMAILLKVYKVADTTYDTATKAELETAVKASAAIDYITLATKTNAKSAVKAAMGEDTTGSYIKMTSSKVASTGTKVYFYEAEYAAVKAAVEKYNADVDAATTEAEMDKAEDTLNTTINNTKTQAQVQALFTSTGAVKTAAEAEFTSLKAYAAALQAAQTAKDSTDALVFDITDITDTSAATTFKDGTLYAYYIANNARTADAVKALNANVKAVLDGAKTNSALIAEANAVDTQIKNLPATVTLENKAAVEAAYDAYNALNPAYQKYVTNKTAVLDKAITAVQTAEKNAILTAVKGLPTTATVTVADKAAVKAVKDQIKAYNDTKMYTSGMPYIGSDSTVNGLLGKIQSLETEALKAQIAALPAADKVTADNKAAIEEARAAYDAYVAEYADNLNTTVLNALEATLAAAEKSLAAAIEALPKYTDTDAKAAILDMSFKATMTKTSKTSRKLKAVAGADQLAELKANGYTVKYRFYKKAPKKTSYKLIKTYTKTTSYKYTKLAKGKNSLKVKISVYNAEGKLVGSKTATKTVTIK